MVESRRGGGGYLRIIRLSMEEEPNLAALLDSARGRRVSGQGGEKLLDRLTEEEFLTGREGMLIKALTDDSVLKSGLTQDGPDSEALRGRMLNAVLQLLLRDDFV